MYDSQIASIVFHKTLSYQREVDKGKLTAVASLEKLSEVSSVNPSSEQSALCSTLL